MGIFLSRNSTQTKHGKGRSGSKGGSKSKGGAKLGAGVDGEAGASGETFFGTRRTWIGGGLRLILILGVLVGLGLGWRAARARLIHYASTAHAAEINREDISIADRPDWMTDAVAQRVRQTVAQRIGKDPMDGQALRDAAGALGNDPWVNQVDQVRRLADGSIRIDARFRRPLAVVQGRDGYHLVDSDLVRLPGLYARHQVDPLGLPLMIGVEAVPPRYAGRCWSSANLQAGLDLISLLRGKAYFDQIEAVEVDQHDARGRLRLVMHTDRGQVVWGLPPGEAGAIEPKTSVKMRRLGKVVDEYGVIDAGGRVVHIHGATIEIERGSTRE